MNIKRFLMVSPLYDWLGKRSYAQSGEDIIAWGELKNSRNQKIRASGWIPDQVGNDTSGTKGFYVDVGAYHPKLFSNTYLFYKKGWKGICIDPNPGLAGLFRMARPRDRFLNIGVGGDKTEKTLPAGRQVKNSKNQNEVFPRWIPDQVGDDKGLKGERRLLEYYMFEDGAANTFSPEQARKNQQEAGRKLIGKKLIPVMPLRKIFEKYLPKGQKIDLLSVDVEGMDEEVLRSNDWKKYRPKMIIAEDLDFDLENFCRDRGGVVGFLNSVGYRLVAKTPYSLIFRVVK